MSTCSTDKSFPATEVEASSRAEGGAPPVAFVRWPIKVFMMDLWCYVPYYDGYLCKSLGGADVDLTLGAISYHRDRGHFARLGLQNDPGLLDVVSRLPLRNALARRALKFLEFLVNSLALAIRFAWTAPDILHVQFVPILEKGLPLEIWFLQYVRRLGIKIVYTVHNVLPQSTGQLRKEIYQRAYRLADALICHNEAAQTRLIEEFGLDPKRIWLIPHGPMFHDQQPPSVEEARARLGFPPGQCVILWQGIVKPYKGLDFLLEAWRAVQAQGRDACLVIAGSGEEKQLRAVEDKVRSLGVESSVRLELRFLSVRELTLYYQAADVIAYPYKEITTSGALMTGLSYKKALVATNLPPFREVLRDGDNAALVEYGDVGGLAAVLRRLIQQPSERKRLAEGIPAVTADENPWAPIAHETLRCYHSLL
ncbi:MAG TPA: glycosyltransferase [Candidatus Acidoferrales bacterium]|nr:glycosyltransferase [Candidatus Acidoferrales bacterium]